MLGAIRAGSSKPPEPAVQEAAFFIHHGVSMDSLHAIGFYVSSGISLAGGLGVALLPLRDQRGASMAVAGIGLAGIYFSLSAGFVRRVGAVCFCGRATLLAGGRNLTLARLSSPLGGQRGGVRAPPPPSPHPGT